MTFFAYGLIGLFGVNKTGSENIVFESKSVGNSPTEIKTISVDIEVTVINPGVYKLPQDSRIQDAFIAAGGLSAQADRKYVAKNINLAIKLTDGAKILYVPNLEEAVNQVSVPDGSTQGATADTLININTASGSDLDSLPGIGPVTAQKITGRQYNSISELKDKKVVSARVFDQIKDKITAY